MKAFATKHNILFKYRHFCMLYVLPSLTLLIFPPIFGVDFMRYVLNGDSYTQVSLFIHIELIKLYNIPLSYLPSLLLLYMYIVCFPSGI